MPDQLGHGNPEIERQIEAAELQRRFPIAASVALWEKETSLQAMEL